jgi:putative phosphoesterase
VAERLALLGDVHANLPALRAVLRAMDSADLARGACTGDLVMRGNDPEGCVREIRRLGWPCVMGNTDRKVAMRPRRDPAHPKARRVGSRAWSTNQLSWSSLRYLAALPLVVRLPLDSATVAVMHGGPTDPRSAIDEDTPESALIHLARELGADCVVSGHTHRPFVREAGGRLFVNPGSVGEALAGDRRPRWAWLEARDGAVRAHLEQAPDEVAMIRGG